MPNPRGGDSAGLLDTGGDIEGAALEGLVLQHLRAWIGYGNMDCRVYFWRTRSGSEVDFVLYGAAGFWAIEVNNGCSLRPADLRGIRAFHQDYPEATPLVLYRGTDTVQRDGVCCTPVDRFLRDLAPSRKFPT